MSRAPGIIRRRPGAHRRALLQETLVVAQHQLAVDLAHQLERDADGDQHVVPANGKFCTSDDPQQEVRQDRDDGDEQRAGQGDAVDDLGQVALGLRAGTDAGDEAALPADLIGLTDRVEGDRVVEVGEGDDQQREQGDVDEFWQLTM